VEEAEHVLDNLRANFSHSKSVLPATDHVAEAAYTAGHFAVAAGLFGSMTADENPPEMVSRALVKLGWCRYETGENEAAEQAFGTFLEKFASDKQAPEVTLVRGQALERAGKDKEAIAAYRQGMNRYPKAKEMPLIIAACAEVYDRLQQDEDAVPLYQRVVREFPNSPDIDAVLYNLAWSLRDLGRGNDSDKVFRKLFEEQPNSRFWPDSAYRLAERASQRGEREAANAYLEPLVNGDCPGAVKQYAIYLQAQIAIGEEKWTLAQVPLERLQKEFPESPLCLAAEFWRAEAAYRSGDNDTATERFNALAPKVTKDSESWMAIIPLRQAQLLAQQKRWSEARVIAEKIAQDFPKFDRQYEADFLIGRAMAADADLDHARTMFDQVVHSTAGSKTETAAMAQWMIGQTYFQQENYASALREFGKVELRFSSYPRWQASALLQEAKCNDQLGHAKEAADIYARLLQSFPQTEFVAEATKGLTETSRK
jgi:TolA-binding protein